MRNRIVASIALLSCLALFGAKYLGFLAPPAATVVGEPIERISLFDLEGNERSFDELEGNETVVYFFTSWCSPCFETLGNLQQLKEEHTFSQSLLAVALDSDIEGINQMVKRSKFEGNVWIAAAGTMALQQRLFRNERRAVPYVIKIDGQTNIRERAYKLGRIEAWKLVLVEGVPLSDASTRNTSMTQ